MVLRAGIFCFSFLPVKLTDIFFLKGIRPVPVFHETGSALPVAGLYQFNEEVMLRAVALFPVNIVPMTGEVVQALF